MLETAHVRWVQVPFFAQLRRHAKPLLVALNCGVLLFSAACSGEQDSGGGRGKLEESGGSATGPDTAVTTIEYYPEESLGLLYLDGIAADNADGSGVTRGPTERWRSEYDWKMQALLDRINNASVTELDRQGRDVLTDKSREEIRHILLDATEKWSGDPITACVAWEILADNFPCDVWVNRIDGLKYSPWGEAARYIPHRLSPETLNEPATQRPLLKEAVARHVSGGHLVKLRRPNKKVEQFLEWRAKVDRDPGVVITYYLSSGQTDAAVRRAWNDDCVWPIVQWKKPDDCYAALEKLVNAKLEVAVREGRYKTDLSRKLAKFSFAGPTQQKVDALMQHVKERAGAATKTARQIRLEEQRLREEAGEFFKQHRDDVAALRKAIKSPNRYIRLALFERRHFDMALDRALPELIKAGLRDGDEEVRLAALRKFNNCWKRVPDVGPRTEGLVPELLKLLDDEETCGPAAAALCHFELDTDVGRKVLKTYAALEKKKAEWRLELIPILAHVAKPAPESARFARRQLGNEEVTCWGKHVTALVQLLDKCDQRAPGDAKLALAAACAAHKPKFNPNADHGAFLGILERLAGGDLIPMLLRATRTQAGAEHVTKASSYYFPVRALDWYSHYKVDAIMPYKAEIEELAQTSDFQSYQLQRVVETLQRKASGNATNGRASDTFASDAGRMFF
ncbi:MAG: hypothetical protein KAY37_11250 [Phycisphaerae bacterium]|nr:hypothetical protein [Phycisphaerae bacterium]